jgi:hypothetical protein
MEKWYLLKQERGKGMKKNGGGGELKNKIFNVV